MESLDHSTVLVLLFFVVFFFFFFFVVFFFFFVNLMLLPRAIFSQLSLLALGFFHHCFRTEQLFQIGDSFKTQNQTVNSEYPDETARKRSLIRLYSL